MAPLGIEPATFRIVAQCLNKLRRPHQMCRKILNQVSQLSDTVLQLNLRNECFFGPGLHILENQFKPQRGSCGILYGQDNTGANFVATLSVSSTLVCICFVRLLFVLLGCYLCCSVVICVVRLLFALFGCYLRCSVVICVVRLLFVLFGCYVCCSVVICVFRLLFVLFGCYLCCSVVICVIQLLFVLFYVLFVYKCVLPPGDNPTAVKLLAPEFDI